MTRKDCVGFVALAAILLTAAVARPQTVDGGFQTGNDLLRLCLDPTSVLACYGYLQGAADTMRVVTQTVGGSCDAAVGKTAGQLRLEFIKLATEQPAGLHRSASWYVMGITGCDFGEQPKPAPRRGGKLVPPERPSTMQ